jgi:hypothetical protein
MGYTRSRAVLELIQLNFNNLTVNERVRTTSSKKVPITSYYLAWLTHLRMGVGPFRTPTMNNFTVIVAILGRH